MIKIAGGGLAGLLASCMLVKRDPNLYELQPELPNNHSAILRFRSSIVGDTLGIPFRKVTMIKTSLPWKNPVADALAYSLKNTGLMRSDRSIIAGMTVAERYIAPADLISRMAMLAHRFHWETACPFLDASEPIISTIPMPSLMRLLGYPHDQDIFRARSGVNIRAKIADCDAYVSLMIPDPASAFSRISITGDEMIVECKDIQNSPENAAIHAAEQYLGISREALSDITSHRSIYAKILPIDEDIRKDFMFWATDKFNIFSLGRFATWRPTLLLDDLVNDIRKIDGWIDRGNRYNAMRSRS